MPDTASFLQQVITTPSGYFNLCLRSSSGIWHEEFYEWPNQQELITNLAEQSSSEYDVYFSAYLYSQRDSHKEFVLPSRTIQQDLDNADPLSVPIQPTCLVQTSPNRYQGFWLTNELLDLELHELLSKRLAYAIPNCDHSGWSLGHKVRLPGTLNHKYLDGPHKIEVVSSNTRRYAIEELELLPDIDTLSLERFDLDFIENPPTQAPNNQGPFELVESIKDQLSASVYNAYLSTEPATDRSAALWALTTQCFKHGLTREQVYWVAKHSANNKFDRLRYHAERELAKDILRAEFSVKTQATDIKAIVNNIRRQTKLLVNDRRRLIYDVVANHLRELGSFVRMRDSRKYYILHDKGMPVFVGPRSEQLDSILDIRFGLNKTEPEHEYVVHALNSMANQLPETGIASALSYHDPQQNHLLIHSGQKTVYKITPNSIDQLTDGCYDVVFPWSNVLSPFAANLSSTNDIDWGNVLFGGMYNVLNLTAQEVEVLLKVWFMFVLFRNSARSRPILALYGQPGSGKTTMACKIFTLIYGQNLEVSGVTDAENFDMASAYLPLFVLDNLDTYEKWIPDRLAQSARTTDVIVRRKYTDLDVIRLRRQAVLVITAHDPKFSRADITSRLLILSMTQLGSWADEQTILDNVLINRNKLWGAIFRDVQKILANPIVEDTPVQIRIQDFARLGDWIAKGLDCQSTFREAITKIKGSQYAFNLNEDQILVNAIQNYVATYVKHGKKPPPKKQDDLFAELMIAAGDEGKAFLHRYRNSISLGKRISNLQASLSTQFNIAQFPGKGSQRMWLIEPLDQEEVEDV